MDLLTVVLITVVVGYLYAWWNGKFLPKNYPPGPRGLPLLGYIPFFGKEPLHHLFEKIGVKYGGIYHIPAIRQLVILNDWASIKEAIRDQSDIFSGRPIGFVLDNLTHRLDIISADGPIWKEKRRFALHHMRDLGVGKTELEAIILGEIEKLNEVIDSQGERKVDVSELFFMPILNVVWGIVAGRTYDYEDNTMKTFCKTFKSLFDLMNRTIPYNGHPLMLRLPKSPYPQLKKVYQKVNEFLESEIDEHERNYKEGAVPDFINIFLAEMKATNNTKSPNEAFQKQHLLGVIFSFFTAGVETIQSTLHWSLLYVTTWPEIQEKIQEELDRVIGRDRLPTYSDRSLLPYTEAVLLEIHRYASIVPASVPHSNVKETTIRGYTIPKRTFIIQHIRAVHFDPKLWGDPEVFRPERFIDEAGNVQKPEYLIPFSLGARQCLGEILARVELFLFFTCILQRYRLRFVTGEKPPSFDPVVTITLTPQPYKLMFKRR